METEERTIITYHFLLISTVNEPKMLRFQGQVLLSITKYFVILGFTSILSWSCLVSKSLWILFYWRLMFFVFGLFFFLKNMKHAVMNRQLISYGEKDWIVVLVLKLEMYSLHFTYNCEGFYKMKKRRVYRCPSHCTAPGSCKKWSIIP